MVSVQFFDQNAPRSIASVQASAVNDVYDDQHQQQLRPSITIDGIYVMDKYFYFEIDSDLESVLTDSTYNSDSDDSSYCSVNFDSDSDSDNDSNDDDLLQLPKTPLTSIQNDTCTLFDEFKRINTNRHSNDDLDEELSITSYDSLEDARQRGLVGRPKDWDSPHPWRPPARRQWNKELLIPKSEIELDFESDEETIAYGIALK